MSETIRTEKRDNELYDTIQFRCNDRRSKREKLIQTIIAIVVGLPFLSNGYVSIDLYYLNLQK